MFIDTGKKYDKISTTRLCQHFFNNDRFRPDISRLCGEVVVVVEGESKMLKLFRSTYIR